MKNSMRISLISVLLFAWGCSDSDGGSNNNGGQPVTPPPPPVIVPPPVADGVVTVEFPGLSAVTTASILTVRGSADKNVSNIEVKGVAAQVFERPSENIWISEVPLEYGENHLTLSYSTNEKQKSLTLRPVQRLNEFAQSPAVMTRAGQTRETFIFDDSTHSLLKLDNDNKISFVYQFRVENDPDANQSKDEAHEATPYGMWVNKEASHLYYTTRFNGQFYIWGMDLETNIPYQIFGPGTHGYQNLLVNKAFPLLYRENENQLIIAHGVPVNSITGFDLDSGQLVDYNIKKPSFRYLSLVQKSNDVLLALTETQIGTNAFGEINLKQGSLMQYTYTPVIQGACRAFNNMDKFAFHHTSEHFVIAKASSLLSDDVICGINTSPTIFRPVTGYFDEYPDSGINSDYMSIAGNNLYFGGTDKNSYRINHYALSTTFPNGKANRTQIGDLISAGNSEIAPHTAREVLYDQKANKLYWVIKQSKNSSLGQIQVLDIASGEWSHLGDYAYKSFKGAELNPEDNSIYIVNDDLTSDDALIKIDLETGRDEVVIGAVEKATLAKPDFTIVASAINPEKQVIYLARKVHGRYLNPGQYPFSLLAYEISSGELSELVPVSRRPVSVGYEMAFDPQGNRVLFYDDHSGTEYQIRAINVDTGEISTLSQEKTMDGPDIYNSRDHIIDSEHNQLLSLSQEHESIYAVDLNTGIRTMVSGEEPESGPVFIRPTGIDLIGKQNIAVVADEEINALYWVDLLTRERVIIQR
ncbi:hypothetical protein L3Q72_13900 [Vibrio sp. JC009]|uniref:hypothetical protein n=1 Tax=Vibrio sp. JC009 TaxID=2912314 RepID=UPI0023AF47B5|nr:hypothetical protein [Vibrio sp. JC009]WED21687.1 hypothetical protein L3Q72_13900 [Vibrio sp. JC009]